MNYVFFLIRLDLIGIACVILMPSMRIFDDFFNGGGFRWLLSGRRGRRGRHGNQKRIGGASPARLRMLASYAP